MIRKQTFKKHTHLFKCCGGPWDGKTIELCGPSYGTRTGTHVFTCKGLTGHYNSCNQWVPYD